jgi:antitoxin ParD1/3/4
MGSRSTVNVSLTPALVRFISARVASGRYQSASEVVREGLRLLEEREQSRVTTLDDLRREVAIGMDQARRGEVVDGDAAFRQVLGRLKKRSAAKPIRRRAG